MKAMTRRQFGKTVAATAALANIAMPEHSPGQSTAAAQDLEFPKGFVWGCATAAYQIEGAAKEDGRKPSIWDMFAHTPGKTLDGDTGDVADDSYHLYKQDMSYEKSRRRGISHVHLLVARVSRRHGTAECLGAGLLQARVGRVLESGITPYVTLFHWDLPAALEGGWQSRDTAKAFADYAGYVAGQLADRVHHFMTINEFDCFTDLGYRTGKFAPGLMLPAAEVTQVRHHAILAHGLGVQAIRASAPSGTRWDWRRIRQSLCR